MTTQGTSEAAREAARAEAERRAYEVWPNPAELVDTPVLGGLIEKRAAFTVAFVVGAEWAESQRLARYEDALGRIANVYVNDHTMRGAAREALRERGQEVSGPEA